MAAFESPTFCSKTSTPSIAEFLSKVEYQKKIEHKSVERVFPRTASVELYRYRMISIRRSSTTSVEIESFF